MLLNVGAHCNTDDKNERNDPIILWVRYFKGSHNTKYIISDLNKFGF